MTPGVLSFPFSVSHRDPSGLFAIETTVVAWREDRGDAADVGAITLTLGAGTLHDADKGAFGLDGLELAMRVANGRIEPTRVLAPGVLSELQQEALLDAVSSALNAGGRLFPQLARRNPS
jgi:hypothetical protein